VVNNVPVDLPPPQATVVIPTYNYAEVLPFAIGSVLNQTFRDFELLVIGDGCTDDSERVVAATGDPRVHWINLTKNSGHQVGPNNEGLQRAGGAVVAYLGHDDLWLPSHLESLMGAFDSDVPAAHTSVLQVHPGRCYTEPESGWSYTRGASVPPSSMAFRRSDALDVGGWRDAKGTGHLAPEADLLARVFDVAGPPAWVPRLTCVKLEASKRPNVYRNRPTHEQAHWFALIRGADDPENAVRAQVGLPYDLAGDGVASIGLHSRMWRSAQYWLLKRLGLTPIKAKTRIRRAQRFKGLP
jgi:glycosyltransferase involved in cell wall biosynthesis